MLGTLGETGEGTREKGEEGCRFGLMSVCSVWRLGLGLGWTVDVIMWGHICVW